MIVKIGEIGLGDANPFCLIAGPCVIESEALILETARRLKEICFSVRVPLVFKASYDKANRTSIKSFRGPGLEAGLRILRRVKEELSLPVLSDIHQPSDAAPAAEVLDVLQIPAFLCRQTDLLLAAGRTGRPVNVKKGQFLAPEDTRHLVGKIESTGNRRVLLTERGSCFGYHNLVVDFRGLEVMGAFAPVIFDATHSVQQPSAGETSGGCRQFVPLLVRAALAAGCAGLFLEVHPDPERACSDGPNMVKLDDLPGLLAEAKAIDQVVKERWKR
ncbi:MAG TPA: 3-deoxy-8-phosphooctulonate synthase [bacterium]|nr:3-deoxy-8-phosphooctulonate synthase [bacterium]HNS49069.1 3-deoxy-8-phosphooctulonate synthase [bacterium]